MCSSFISDSRCERKTFSAHPFFFDDRDLFDIYIYMFGICASCEPMTKCIQVKYRLPQNIGEHFSCIFQIFKPMMTMMVHHSWMLEIAFLKCSRIYIIRWTSTHTQTHTQCVCAHCSLSLSLQYHFVSAHRWTHKDMWSNPIVIYYA